MLDVIQDLFIKEQYQENKPFLYLQNIFLYLNKTHFSILAKTDLLKLYAFHIAPMFLKTNYFVGIILFSLKVFACFSAMSSYLFIIKYELPEVIRAFMKLEENSG